LKIFIQLDEIGRKARHPDYQVPIIIRLPLSLSQGVGVHDIVLQLHAALLEKAPELKKI